MPAPWLSVRGGTNPVEYGKVGEWGQEKMPGRPGFLLLPLPRDFGGDYTASTSRRGEGMRVGEEIERRVGDRVRTGDIQNHNLAL